MAGMVILSDIHGNLEALLAVLSRIPNGIPLICLGDVVGYGPDPGPCLDILQARRAIIIKGNHDAAVTDDRILAWFNPLAREALLWTRSRLTPAQTDFLSGLPESVSLHGLQFVHGTPMNPVFDYMDAPTAQRIIAGHPNSRCFVGHTHQACCYTPAEAVPIRDEWSMDLCSPFVFNVGSVGQPRDGSPKASYCFVEINMDSLALTLEFRRSSYDIAATQRKMQLAGLPEKLSTRLSLGH